MRALLAAAFLSIALRAAAGGCLRYDTSQSPAMKVSSACPEDMGKVGRDLPPNTPYGVYWRKIGQDLYRLDIYARNQGRGFAQPMRMADDKDYVMAIRYDDPERGSYQVNPKPKDYLDRALVEEAIGRPHWAKAYALLGLVFAPDNERLRALSARRAEPLPDAVAQQAAFQAYANAHRGLERGTAKDSPAWLDASISMRPSAEAYALRSTLRRKAGDYQGALSDADAGLALSPRDDGLSDARAQAAEALDRHPARPHAAAAALAAAAPEPVVAPEKAMPGSTRGQPIASAPVFVEPEAPLPMASRALAEARSEPERQPSNFHLYAAVTGLLAMGIGIGAMLARAQTARPASRADATTVAADADDTPTVKTPKVFPREPVAGRYDLGRQIGQGGMGVVYEAYERTDSKRVAIKQMRAEIKDDEHARMGFKREAEIIAKISHPNIVNFREMIEDKGELYLVFDYVDGKPLSTILHERGRLPVAEAAEIFTKVCLAISTAHAAHILHRDLKPSNIMIDTTGEVKVMDFGIARAAKDTITRLTRLDASGTPAFMAPEQHLGRCAKASDIYALGVCLYQTLTGKLPFPGPDFLAQKERMLFHPPQFIVPTLPKASELLFQITLAADPEKRVADTEELIDSIRRLV